jgi:hypothetical protein
VYYKDNLYGKPLDEIDRKLGIIRNKKYKASTVAHHAGDGVEDTPLSVMGGGNSSAMPVQSLVNKKRASILFGGGPETTTVPAASTTTKRLSVLGFAFGAPVAAESGAGSKKDKRMSVTRLVNSSQIGSAPIETTGFRRTSVLSPDLAPTVNEDEFSVDHSRGHVACVVEKGCILALPVLEGNSLSQYCGDVWRPGTDAESGSGVEADITVQVTSQKLVYSVVSIDMFEMLFGRHALKQVHRLVLCYYITQVVT